MAIRVGQPFKRTGAFPVDESLVLTKAEMLAVEATKMPDLYFALCSDDGKFYIYDKNATPSAETGYYRVMEGGGGIADITFIAPAFDNTATYAVGDVVTYDGKRYVAKNEITTAGNFDPADWNEQDVQAAIDSVSGDSSLGTDYTTNIAVGGLASGTELHATDMIASVLKRMLVTTYYPTFVDPSVTIESDFPRIERVGEPANGSFFRALFDPGSIILQETKQNNLVGSPTKYKLTISGSSIADGTLESDTETFSHLVYQILQEVRREEKGTIEYTMSVEYGAGPQPKDSDGKDFGEPREAGVVVSKKYSTDIIIPFFYGASDSKVIESPEYSPNYNMDMTKKGTKKYVFNTNNQYVYIAYDKAYGDLKSIKDQNDFKCIDGFTKSTIVSATDNQTYLVYVQNTATTDTEAEYTFEF